MKASTRRTVALVWSRLHHHPKEAAGLVHFRAMATSTSATTPGKLPFSTAVRENSYEDEDDHCDSPQSLLFTSRIRTTYQHRTQSTAAAAKPPQCTCGYQDPKDVDHDAHDPLPPPSPEPIYSVHRRILPDILTGLSTPRGRQYLQESLASGMAESYWALTEQFVNQSDPAYCGVTTLLMILNAMNVDPNSRWKGGWRFYGDENVLLQRCCLNTERIRRVGITMEQFTILGTCHGMRITMKRPYVENDIGVQDDDEDTPKYTLEDFRRDIRQTMDSNINSENAMLVVSYSRAALQQTGDGHFSPIAAYHEESDHVLILDVARFKYSPYWVSVEDLYRSLEPLDEVTQRPRGWYVMRPPAKQKNYYEMTNEDRRPAHLVPQSHEEEACPVGKIKVEFCPAKNKNSSK
jgi:glutathione gamma-glutamylcysteinyltransferase